MGAVLEVGSLEEPSAFRRSQRRPQAGSGDATTPLAGFVSAASHRDTAGMRIAATASGMAAARDTDPAMQQWLPAELLRLGMTTHAAWDALAAAVGAGKPIDRTGAS